jgi:hypothetical protein
MTSRMGGSRSAASQSARTHRASTVIIPDPALLRLGAALGLLGIVVQVVMDRLHPHQVAPNDSVLVFREYAGSRGWTAVHIGQFAGTLLIVLALVALARTLSAQSGAAGALALVATVTAVLVAAVFAVQMAVDGVALKAAIQAWTAADTPVSQAATFQVAESVRWTEKGLGGFFQILNGATLVCLGCSIALGDRYPTWLGLVGAAGGVAFIVGGVATAHTGFSPEAGRFLLPGTVLLAVVLVGAVVLMWRRAGGRPVG